MRQIICLVMLVISSCSAYSQETTDDYRPFVEEGKVWYLSNTEGLYRTPRRNYFDGDTLIHGKHCKKWIQEEGVFQQAEMAIYSIYAFEEDKRVCFFQEGDTIPRLFFDFGAEIGDTLIVQSAYARVFANLTNGSASQVSFQDGLENYEKLCTDTLIITQRGEKVCGGRKQRCIWFNYIKNGTEKSNLWDFMMEGVGSYTAPYWNATSPSGFDLIACTVGDEVLFWGENATSWGLQRPTSISSLTGHAAPHTMSYFDLSGRRLAAPPAKGMYIKNGRKHILLQH